MIKLNLATNGVEHDVLKEYLEENASAALAEKINYGVFIEKDGKRLLNRKDLNGFMKYACNEAQKLAAKGATSACMKSDTVFGWAIHYFEEDDIIGKLYNEDGSEYKPTPAPTPKPVQRVPAPTIPIKPTPPKSQQFNLFDLVANANAEEPKQEKDVTDAVENIKAEEYISTDEPEDTEEYEDICTLNVNRETGEIIPAQPIKESPSPLYRKYMSVQEQYPDYIIAFRIGDFYEVFGDNAIKVSNDLDLTLTGRDCGLVNRIPMIGFPYYSADGYLQKIAQCHPVVTVDGEDVTIYPVLQETVVDNDDEEFAEELERQQYFDKDALCMLYELFDGAMDMQ